MSSLMEIFDKYNCDKGSRRHRYDRVYEPSLQHLKNQKIKILEIGILKGESLESWLDFFPNATIIGIDIFTRVPANKISILQHSRISWCNCDSISGPNDNFRTLVSDDKFDIIVDDGLHTHDSQRKTFENFIPYLKDDGIYFIEDVWPFSSMTDQEKKHSWILKHSTWYSDKQYSKLLSVINNYKVNFHDLRKDYHPDTYIIEVRK